MREATKFEVYRTEEGRFRWRFTDDDGVPVPFKVGRIEGFPMTKGPEIAEMVQAGLAEAYADQERCKRARPGDDVG